MSAKLELVLWRGSSVYFRLTCRLARWCRPCPSCMCFELNMLQGYMLILCECQLDLQPLASESYIAITYVQHWVTHECLSGHHAHRHPNLPFSTPWTCYAAQWKHPFTFNTANASVSRDGTCQTCGLQRTLGPCQIPCLPHHTCMF